MDRIVFAVEYGTANGLKVQTVSVEVDGNLLAIRRVTAVLASTRTMLCDNRFNFDALRHEDDEEEE